MFRKHLFPQTSTVLTCLLSVCLLSQPTLVEAGCGCTKAPPVPAAVRPHATYAGTEVTLFHPDLQTGQGYDVTFASGISGESASVSSQAVTRRDLADGVEKPQLVVSLPDLPLGPTSVSVSLTGQDGAIMAADDSALTVAPQPIVVPTEVGAFELPDFQAAVSRDGTVYLSLDLSAVTLPRTFHAHVQGYPLRFSHDEVVFYNIQGFVMQLLEESMAGLFAVNTTDAADSDTLMYSRHEFNTYFLKHDERQPHAIDALNPNWHADGSYHIDHNHQVVAIAGTLADGSLPVPGATPAATLELHVASLFQHGLVADTVVEMQAWTGVDSYNSTDGLFGAAGDILSNGTISLVKNAVVSGDATAFTFDIRDNAEVSGATILATEPTPLMPFDIPTLLEDLGSIVLDLDDTLTLVGPGSYQVTEILITGQSQLFIDNTTGPVTLYITGEVHVSGQATISVADPDPEKFALYVTGSGEVKIAGNGAFYGVVYAPASWVELSGNGEFFGAFVGATVTMTGRTTVHYDTALRGQAASSGSEPPSTGPSETTTSSTGGDSLTSTDATASGDTTPPSNSPDNGKGKGKK